MKKILALGFCALFASCAYADFARIEMGIGAWQQTPSGEMSYDNGFSGKDISKEVEEQEVYAWLLIKHPVPIVPNFRIEYSSMSSAGIATGTFKNFYIPANSSANTTLDVVALDVIPYYNILDNTGWITLDIGVDFKLIETKYEATNVRMFNLPITLPITYTDTESAVIPLLYVRTRFEVPTTGLGVEADGKYITYNGSTLYDVRAKIDYTFDFGLPIDPGIEIGYRLQKIKLDDSESAGDVKTDLDFSGFYAGIMFRF